MNINLLSQKFYWIDKLSGELPETNLLLDYTRPANSLPKDKLFSFNLSRDLSQTIIKLARGSYFSTYWILLSALNVLLQKYTRNQDVIVGIPMYEDLDRHCAQSQVVPLRTLVKPQLSFKDYLWQVKDDIINAYNNQDCNFDELIQLLKISTSSHRSPIFDLVILLENIHNKDNFSQLNNDITISFLIQNEIISGKIAYSQSLFKAQNIQAIASCYTNILESVLENIEIKISNIPCLNNTERHQLLKQFNNNSQKYPTEQTIEGLFEWQVAQTPHDIAVICKQTQLTYQELNKKSNQLARLLQKLGINRGEFVGILKDRDCNFLIAILAIYKAGGAYIPIDSTYPSHRIEYMLSQSEVKFLLTDASLLNVLLDYSKKYAQLTSIICLDRELPQNIQLAQNRELTICDRLDFTNLATENLEPLNKGIDIAYMLYTSGSTGLPKGAIVRHDGAINHIYAQFDCLGLNSEFCFLQSAPSSTDISVWQFLAPILIGGKTVIVDLETVAIPEQLFKALKSEQIAVVELVPTLFSRLVEYISQLPNHQRLLPDLKWMMLSGESISPEWVNKWLELYPSVKIANAYGPTEAADDITQFIVDKPLPDNQPRVPIGKPLANLNLYILDESMQLLPIGVPGEICVSGIGVGNGYWKNEEKTKQAFVDNPLIGELLVPKNHETIYKTGDLGRWLSDGKIEFLGRIDNQVKIRGFRLELAVLKQFWCPK